MLLKPRQSGIPTPGKFSSIPTPGRSRSSSAAAQPPIIIPNSEYASQALTDAIKANNPAQHRTPRTSDIGISSLSPTSTSSSVQSGRRSAGRPSSAASQLASPLHKESVLAPATNRPQSRQSDVAGRSASRTGRPFDIGDSVRIESLGFEGTLRFLGEIEGKPGLWAGVELSGGFAGKGKNNGSFNGKQYFSCPPSCGVFVPSTRLSAPTIVAAPLPRPPSASTRLGRVTPSSSGRVTPSSRVVSSLSNGRTTPGEIGGLPKPKTPTLMRKDATSSAITTGSIASRYVGMSAKDLRQAPAKAGRNAPPSAFPSSLSVPDLSSSVSAKAGAQTFTVGSSAPSTPTKSRPSLVTPRARVPSAVAMPPPTMPASVTRTAPLSERLAAPTTPNASNQSFEMDDSAFTPEGRNLHDKSTKLMLPNTPPSLNLSPRPDSAASERSAASEQHQAQIERLQSRLDALQYENERLMSASNEKAQDRAALESLRSERDTALDRIAAMELRVKTAERTASERDSKLDTLQRAVQQSATDLESQKSESSNRVKELQSKLGDHEALVQELKVALETKQGRESENDAVVNAKSAEITLLQSRVDKAYVDFDNERKDLIGQVTELREAGQETIALYEERLSAADAQRYDLEDRIASLEERLRNANLGSNNAGEGVSSAAEIDNEAMCEQIHHLQRKVASMEDALEEAHVATEREEAATRERIRRFKEKEELMKKEFGEGRRELELSQKSEASARRRVEEVEDALRESTSALENARAELEVLRAECANIDGFVDGGSKGPGGSDRVRLTHEIAKLTALLEESRANERAAAQNLENSSTSQTVQELRRTLDERTAELEALRKRSHREMPINGTETLKASSKADAKEVTGLKHIVQELQKENLAISQRNKVLDSENKLLLAETEQLRQELKVLEDNLEQGLALEEQALKSEPEVAINSTVADLQRALREQKSKFEAEMEQLRKKLTEVEMKHTRMVHDLNKEISELEYLVESKIYREDELEQEVERLKEKLTRSNKKLSKTSTEASDTRSRVSLDSSTISSDHSVNGRAVDVCEICEQPGHDIFNCDLLNGGTTTSTTLERTERTERTRTRGHNETKDLFCEDCEGHGHVAADCPHSMDVF